MGGLWGQKVPKLLILHSRAAFWGVGSQKWSIFFGCCFMYPPLKHFGSEPPLMGGWWGKSRKIFQKFAWTQISLRFGAKISALNKNVKNLVKSFMYKGLESNLAKFAQIGAHFEQGGRTGFARLAFWEIRRFDFSCPSPRRGGGVQGLSKIIQGESLCFLVCNGENHLPVSFSVLEKYKFFCRKTAFSSSFSL